MKAVFNRQRAGASGSSGQAENPFQDARRIWNVHTGTALAQQRMWQLVALLALLVALAAVGGVIHIGSQSRYVPYVVEVDSLGKVQAVAEAPRAGKADTRVVTAQVSRFIEDMRTVTPDIAMQRRNILQVYSMLQTSSAAATKANAFYNGATTNPFTRAANQTVTVQINSVLQQTESTWQVDWLESTWNRNGTVVSGDVRMRALLTVEQIPPSPETTEQQMRDNPLGIYVSDFNWSKPL